MGKPSYPLFEKLSKTWVEQGIITQEQQEKILKLYAPSLEKSTGSRLPKIMIALATVLIGLGLLLFYGANWQYMPKIAKLVQIFFLVIGTYSATYYFLAIRENSFLLGRGLLLIALISFGAGIGLISQVYHISSHPTNGVLIWALAGLSFGLMLSESWSLYLTTLLFAIWNFWEFGQYNNPNPLFLVAIGILVFAFYRAKSKVGIIFIVLLVISYFYQINIYYLQKVTKVFDYRHEEVAIFTSALLHLPFGLLLVSLAHRLETLEFWGLPAKFMGAVGWALFLFPMVLMTMPIHFSNTQATSVLHYATLDYTKFLPIEYISLTILSLGTIFCLRKSGKQSWVLLVASILVLLAMILPTHAHTIVQVSACLALFVSLFALPCLTILDCKERHWEQFTFSILTGLLLAVEFVVFIVLGVDRDNHFLTALGTYLLLISTCFVIAYTIRKIFPDSGYSSKFVHILCGVLGFLTLYILSFVDEPRPSPYHKYDANKFYPVIMSLVALNLAGYTFLWMKKHFQQIIFVTSGIFVTITLLLEVFFPVHFGIQLLLINLLMFGVEATMIYHSVIINSAKLLNFALFVFIVHVMTRYFDVFWSMLNGSALFIFTGIVIMIGGYILEKNRRKLLQKIHDDRSESKGAK